jgi:probable F420-dependent oxidoreductase
LLGFVEAPHFAATTGPMKIGFFAPHVGPSSRDGIARACDVADELGADILWAVDHIAFPYGFKAVYPYATHEFGESPDVPLEWWDCLSVLAFLAARTERVLIGTGVLVLPYRHPVATAKAVATVDQLSGGRVLFGVGVGWLQDEFEALQLLPFPERGAVTDEQLQVMQAVWTQDRAAFDGRFYRFPEISVTPKPRQRPHPPILVGGNSPAALRRTVRYGDGWHALMLLPSEMAAHRDRLMKMAGDAGRSGDIPVSLLVGAHLTKDASVYPTLDDPHRRQSMVGTVEQIVDQLVAYRDVGVEHVHTFVTTDDTFGRTDPVDGMELFLREVWPAFLAR